jgi:hypothetical protein
LLMPSEDLKAMEGMLPSHPFHGGGKEAVPEDERKCET